MVPLRRRQDDGDFLAVPDRQLLGHAGGECVISAQDKVIATATRGGI
jgi:hypothetical protein